MGPSRLDGLSAWYNSLDEFARLLRLDGPSTWYNSLGELARLCRALTGFRPGTIPWTSSRGFCALTALRPGTTPWASSRAFVAPGRASGLVQLPGRVRGLF